jgi:hypothetical protein
MNICDFTGSAADDGVGDGGYDWGWESMAGPGAGTNTWGPVPVQTAEVCTCAYLGPCAGTYSWSLAVQTVRAG